MSLRSPEEWKSLKKIKKSFNTSRNETQAIYNKARKLGISYYEAFTLIKPIK